MVLEERYYAEDTFGLKSDSVNKYNLYHSIGLGWYCVSLSGIWGQLSEIVCLNRLQELIVGCRFEHLKDLIYTTYKLILNKLILKPKS